MLVSERRRLEMYGPVEQPAFLAGTRRPRVGTFTEPKGNRSGTAKESSAPVEHATVRGLDLAPISRTSEDDKAQMSVVGTAEKVRRDRMYAERLTRAGEPKAKGKPVECPLTRTAEDIAAGIVRVNVQVSRFVWVQRIDRTCDLDEISLPYRKTVRVNVED